VECTYRPLKGSSIVVHARVVRLVASHGIKRCRAIAQGITVADGWNIRLLKQPHSDLMPANLITLAHFSVSSAISFPKSAGDPGSATPPRSARRAFILGSSRAALTSLLSLSTISAGVALGAPRPDQLLASYPGTNSPTVGTSGSASERVA